MTLLLREDKRDNVVWYYLRERYYKGGVVEEKYRGKATMGDIARVLKPSLVTTRRIFQIVGAWVGIGEILGSLCHLSEERKSEYYPSISFGLTLSPALAALHARIRRLSPEKVLNKLYLDALRSVVSDFKIGKVRAFGVPLTDEDVREAVQLSPVRMDKKDRLTVPKIAEVMFGWKPGNKFQPEIDIEKGKIIYGLVESKKAPRISVRDCEEFLKLPEGFFDACTKLNPVTPSDLSKAIQENISLLSTLEQGAPDISRLLRGLLKTKKTR